MFSLGVKRKVHLRSSLLSSLCSEACYIKRQRCFEIFTNVSVFVFFLWPFTLLQALLSAHRLLVSLYLLSPVTCFVATATCHNPPSVLIFLLAVTCVLSHNALQFTPNKYFEQTENCEYREGSYPDHRLVNRVYGLTSPKSNTFFLSKV